MKREESYLNRSNDGEITVHSANVETYKLNKGERIVLPRKCVRFCASVSGTFSFAVKTREPEYKSIDKTNSLLLFGENQVFESKTDNGELLIAEFEIFSEGAWRLTPTDLHGIYAKFEGNDRRLLDIFIAETPKLKTNKEELKLWLALLVSRLRKEYLRAYRSTLESKNGAIFFGTAPKGKGVFNLCVTDAFLIITDKHSGEKSAVKFSCEYRFLERENDCRCETLSFDNKSDLKYANLDVNDGCFFKIWLFPEKPKEKLNVSPFTHTLKFTFSIKSNLPCIISAGISNLTDYEMASCSLENVNTDVWQDYLLTLFGSDLSEKTNIYIKEVTDYIDFNYNKKITVAELAQRVHLHPNYLSRIFKEYMGCSVSQYVNNKRVTQAKRLLEETDKTVENIANATGFYDSHHLQKCFKLYTGLTPTEYKNKM